MTQKLLFSATLVVSFLFSLLPSSNKWEENTPLTEVLISLGQAKPSHYMDKAEVAQLAKKGEELVKIGRTIGPNGKKTRYISKYYTCTICHNLSQEDPDLRKSDPDARLTYAKKMGLPFLQGSTFKGIVNRETWYNDDYVKKYGELVIKANKSLDESTKLCAVECSQGRELEEWEVEAITAYYWTLEFTLKDLGLDKDFVRKLNNENGANSNLLEELKSYYAQKSPATFVDPPNDKYKGYGLKGNPDRGEDIYNLSCKHCHDEGGASRFLLDDSPLTFRKLKRNIARHNDFSLYEIIRHGTYAQPGARPYMPHYTLERMSHQQVEDLRAYVEAAAD